MRVTDSVTGLAVVDLWRALLRLLRAVAEDEAR